jgi:hypothetical protein
MPIVAYKFIHLPVIHIGPSEDCWEKNDDGGTWKSQRMTLLEKRACGSLVEEWGVFQTVFSCFGRGRN